MANRLFQAFIDTAKTIAGYPITVANAVFMRDGSTLDEFSENIPHREDDEDTNIEVPNIDADMLNGHPADYYAKQSDLSDVVTIIGATLNSLTVAANGYGNMSQDISSFIPNGYKCIGACFASSGSAWFIPVSVFLIGTSVQVYVRNTYTGQDQGAPIINLICIRN